MAAVPARAEAVTASEVVATETAETARVEGATAKVVVGWVD